MKIKVEKFRGKRRTLVGIYKLEIPTNLSEERTKIIKDRKIFEALDIARRECPYGKLIATEI